MARKSQHWYVNTRTRVCSYWHDHPAGDPSYDDCERAAEIQRARIAALKATHPAPYCDCDMCQSRIPRGISQ